MDGSERKFNIFTTNVEIMKSSLYAKIPKVTVARRFGQANDDPARVASMMLQNAIMQDIDEPECNFDQVMRDAIEDRLVPGMGCAWLRLETDTEEKTLEAQIDPVTGEELQAAATYEEVSRQEVMIDHVFWEDFLYSPCRTWRERRWVARRVYMDQDALVKRFGEDVGKQIPMDYNPRGNGHQQQPAAERRAPEGHDLRDLGPSGTPRAVAVQGMAEAAGRGGRPAEAGGLRSLPEAAVRPDHHVQLHRGQRLRDVPGPVQRTRPGQQPHQPAGAGLQGGRRLRLPVPRASSGCCSRAARTP